MSWEVLQTKRFQKAYKKLHGNVQREVDDAVERIAEDPDLGAQKKGDLAALRVYKFRALEQLYLLGYTLDEGVRLIYLEAVGPHENFYRTLKR